MTDNRRDFIQRLTLGGLALGTLPSSLHAAEPMRDAEPTGRLLYRSSLSSAAQTEPWDVSWTKKLTGTHKAVFDSPDLDGGLGVMRAGIVAAQYMDVFKMPASDFSAVIVLRHNGISLAMNQAYWDMYKIGKKLKAQNPLTEQPTDRNPALLREVDGVPKNFAEFAVDKQIARGVIVLACNLAFRDVVDAIVKADKIKDDEAAAKAKSMLIPGIIMQPSGVFATTLAQENGCIYVRAT